MVLNLLFTALDCPFKFCFGYDDHKKFYMLGEKKAIWSHNHEMTFKRGGYLIGDPIFLQMSNRGPPMIKFVDYFPNQNNPPTLNPNPQTP